MAFRGITASPGGRNGLVAFAGGHFTVGVIHGATGTATFDISSQDNVKSLPVK